MKLECAIYDVFTTTRYLGDPLAVVTVSDPSLTQDQKQLIAREFNLSETTFVYPPTHDGHFPTAIFLPHAEIPFAGHPVIGTATHLLSQHPGKTDITLDLKAGPTPIHRVESGAVRASVPVDFKVHPSYLHPNLKSLQKALGPDDFVNKDRAEPVASIVKHMVNFFLLEVASVDALSRMTPSPVDIEIPTAHLGEWAKPAGEKTKVFVYAFVVTGDNQVRARMFGWPGFEDPATGSAACTLGGYLGLKKGKGKWDFEITQGVEMGRKSDIRVVVEVGDGDKVESVEPEGHAVKVMEGSLEV